MQIKLEEKKYLNINLYEIRPEQNIIDNNSLLDAFFRECQCALFLIDMSNDLTLKSIKDILNSIDDEKYPYLKKIIVENKSDIGPDTPSNEVKKILNFYSNVDDITISTKNGDNLDELLNMIYNELNSEEKKLLALNKVKKYELKDISKEEHEGSISLIILGNKDVGKTSFIKRYVDNEFSAHTLMTIGMDKFMKKLKIDERVTYQLELTDTAGQERFRSLPRAYFKNADGVLLVFDENDKQTLDDISGWMKDIENNSGKIEVGEGKYERDIVIYLIGNKIDSYSDNNMDKEKPKEEDKEQLIKELGVKYYEVSCKWNLNIEEVIANITLDCIEMIKLKPKNDNIIQTTRISNTNNNNSKDNGCCAGNKKEKKEKKDKKKK